jgi:broad specificity phosphatase PhoE
MYSTPIKATNKKRTKLNWWEYWIGHCWMTGWQSIRGTFRIWGDLMTNNFKDYTLLHTDDPFTECYEWFWVSLGEDDTYPKFFLEDLMAMCDRIERGEEEVIPMDEDFINRLKELVKDVELD